VQDLIDEITQLREENLELQQQLFELSNTLTPTTPVLNTLNSNINV
jgi:cell division septum initiation protein DivIVA